MGRLTGVETRPTRDLVLTGLLSLFGGPIGTGIGDIREVFVSNLCVLGLDYGPQDDFRTTQ